MFLEGRRSTSADCETEVEYCRNEMQRQGLAAHIKHQNREQMEEREELVSEWWEGVCTATELVFPAMACASVDYIAMEVRHDQELSSEFEGLSLRALEAWVDENENVALFGPVRWEFTQVQEDFTVVHSECDIILNLSREDKEVTETVLCD